MPRRRRQPRRLRRAMARGAAPVFALPLPPECANGTFVAPTLIEIAASREQLDARSVRTGAARRALSRRRAAAAHRCDQRHGLRPDARHPDAHRRNRVRSSCARIRAGNIYVNRNIIGAVVGVQPFGGERLSGTGPKAGGPHYLWRLVRETRPPAAVDAGSGIALPGRPAKPTRCCCVRADGLPVSRRPDRSC